MKISLYATLLGVLVGFALFYLIFGFGRNNKNELVVEKEIYRDTVFLALPPKEVKIRANPRIQYSDTSSDSFSFVLDTLISKDTLKISYSYPENNLFLRFAAMPDTFRYERTILNIKQPGNNCRLQDKLLYAISGAAVGLIIAKIK
ncbi:MAG: hypothetical protein N3A67_01605 [Ignavibacteria bacterium]|nr:hypothetical protein [Ignavibacteria bacterium]